MIILMKTTFSELFLHEVLGIGLIGRFLLHIGGNNKWTTGVFTAMKRGRVNCRAKVKFFLNILLLIFTIIIGISSILISKEIILIDIRADYNFWKEIHIFSAHVLFILISIHIGLHFKIIKTMIKKIVPLNLTPILRRIFATFILIIFIFLGIKGITNQGIQSDFILDLEEENRNQEEGKDGKNYSNHDLEDPERNGYRLATVEELPSYIDPLEKTPSLHEFLGRFVCTECSILCPLTELQCILGEAPLERAVEEYNQTYEVSKTVGDVGGNRFEYLGIMGITIAGVSYAISGINYRKGKRKSVNTD